MAEENGTEKTSKKKKNTDMWLNKVPEKKTTA